ncbi:MAG: redox-regulated ATPase YchF [Nitrospirae bacterium]|nr:redox-regulated ATPase YchF [Nitrospirota bacterium]
METGLIGLPLSGKTTIYNAVTGRNAATSAYAGGKKDVNIADINVPDPRVDDLLALFRPKKTVYAKIVLKDLQVGFDETGGLASDALAQIRNLDMLVIVVRAFESDSVPHPSGKVDAAADLKKMVESLVFSDYEVVEKRMQRLEKEGKKGSREYEILERMGQRLLGNLPIGPDFVPEADLKVLSGLTFVTTKPILAVANTGDKKVDLSSAERTLGELKIDLFTLQGAMEMEIAQLGPDDQKEFLTDLGMKEPALNRFVRHIYKTLNFISFLTVGEDEVRAWSVQQGANAQKAAGRIHSDLEKGFIRAEVVTCSDLLALKTLAEARRQGKLRQEGKEYVVKDGDVLNILFHV